MNTLLTAGAAIPSFCMCANNASQRSTQGVCATRMGNARSHEFRVRIIAPLEPAVAKGCKGRGLRDPWPESWPGTLATVPFAAWEGL